MVTDRPGGMADAAREELVLVRDFAAPPELVWKCWTEPQHFMAWWGPHGFDAPHAKVDLRVGGEWLACMRGIEGEWAGKEIWSKGTYREIVPNKRLVMTDNFSDAEGNIVDPAHYGMEHYPNGTTITIELEEHGGGTRVTLTHAVPLEVARKFGEEEGWSQSFEKLEQYLPTLEAK